MTIVTRRKSVLSRCLSYRAPRATNCLFARGAGTTTYSNASAARTVVDHEGVVRSVLAGEVRFNGMRRVRNTIPTVVSTWSGVSNTTVASGVADPDGGTAAYTITATGASAQRYHPNGHPSGATSLHWMWVRRRTGTGQINMYNGGAAGATTDITSLISSTWAKIVCPVQTSTGGRNLGFFLGTSGDAIDVYHGQAEDVTGQSIQTPAEYVSTGTGGPNYGVELVANGSNLTNTTGWSAVSAASISASGGNLVVTATGTGGGFASYTIQTVIGNVYRISVNAVSGSGQYMGIQSGSGITLSANGVNTLQFTATATSHNLLLGWLTTSNGLVSTWGSISVQQCLFSGANVDGVKYFNTRLDGTPITGGGQLNEPARTNLCLNSKDVSQGQWTLDQSGTGVLPVRTANYGIAPDGTQTACRVQLDKGAGTGFSRIQQIINAASGIYSDAIWLKTTDGSTKTVGVRNDAKGVASTITGTWKRFSVTTDVATVTPALQVLLWDTLSTSQTADLLVWQGQVELGSSATSDIFTSTSSVTRAADSSTDPVAVVVGPTNLALWSQDVSNAAWTKTNSTTPNAYTLMETAANAAHYATSTAVTVTANATYTIAARVQPNGRTSVEVQFGNGSQFARVNLTTGAVIDSASATNITVTDANDGSGDKLLVFNASTASSSASILVVTSNGLSGTSGIIYSGDVSKGLIVRQVGLFTGTYTAAQLLAAGGIPTTTTAPNALSQGTLLVTLAASGADGTNRYPGVELRDGAAHNNFFTLALTPTLGLTFLATSGGSTLINYLSSVTFTPNTIYKIGVSWSPSRICLIVNGTVINSWANTTLPLSLGELAAAYGSAYPWLGTVSDTRVYSQALPDALMKALTL